MKCQRCHKQFSEVWSAGDDLYAIVTGKLDGEGIFCPKCFEKMAKRKGIQLHWKCVVNRAIWRKLQEGVATG